MSRFPHHADHVGSLLRPERLATARQFVARRRPSSANSWRRSRTSASPSWSAQQQAIGLGAVTDGEFRRDWWHLDFLSGFDGIGLGATAAPGRLPG